MAGIHYEKGLGVKLSLSHAGTFHFVSCDGDHPRGCWDYAEFLTRTDGNDPTYRHDARGALQKSCRVGYGPACRETGKGTDLT